LGDDGLLLTPTLASAAISLTGACALTLTYTGCPEVYSTAVQNVTGTPHSLPLRMLPTGLPFGLQVTAAHYDDYLLSTSPISWKRPYPWAPQRARYESLATSWRHERTVIESNRCIEHESVK